MSSSKHNSVQSSGEHRETSIRDGRVVSLRGVAIPSNVVASVGISNRRMWMPLVGRLAAAARGLSDYDRALHVGKRTVQP